MISTFLLFDWASGGSPAACRVFRLAAHPRTNRALRAGRNTVPRLPAARRTSLTAPARRDAALQAPARRDTAILRPARAEAIIQREASGRMSISSNLVFFRGESITLDFQMS